MNARVQTEETPGKPSSTSYMGLFGSDSCSDSGSLFRRRSKESSSSSPPKPKSLSEVQDELVKKYPPSAVVILTRTPSRSADDFRWWDYHGPKHRYPTCEEWIEKFYEYQRLCGRNCPVWSKIQIETCGLEVYPEKLLNDST
ncbi:hypothetical protein ABKV19_024433 [Rosa sericea]